MPYLRPLSAERRRGRTTMRQGTAANQLVRALRGRGKPGGDVGFPCRTNRRRADGCWGASLGGRGQHVAPDPPTIFASIHPDAVSGRDLRSAKAERAPSCRSPAPAGFSTGFFYWFHARARWSATRRQAARRSPCAQLARNSSTTRVTYKREVAVTLPRQPAFQPDLIRSMRQPVGRWNGPQCARTEPASASSYSASVSLTSCRQRRSPHSHTNS